MNTTPYRLEPATVNDQPTIISLIEEAAGWLNHKGTDQWAKPWPTRQGREERVRKSLDAGTTWMLWDGSTAVATITAERNGSRRLWTDEELRQPAVYVHRLVVRRTYAGGRIGTKLLDWAAALAAVENRASEVRIDVWTTNTALHRYYEGIGFTRVRTADPDADGNWDCPSLALFRRPIAEHCSLSGEATTA
jgi:ribosomal protein S18 acetylase RimI-like enzyme